MLTMPEPARVTIAAIQTGVEVTDLSLDMQLGGILSRHLRMDRHAQHECCRIWWTGDERGRTIGYGPSRPDVYSQSGTARSSATLASGTAARTARDRHPGRCHPRDPHANGYAGARWPTRSSPAWWVLQYQPTPETAQNVAPVDTHLSLVLQALSDFHYNALKLGVQYEEDGTLKLTARLEGKNPDWQQGRPVHFNLTVQENVPALLKSLRVVQGIEQSLQEHLQRR